MALLKINLVTLVVEVYAVAALLFEMNIPGSSFLQETPLAKLSISFLPMILTFVARIIEGWNLIAFPTLLCAFSIPIAVVTSGRLKIVLAFLLSLFVLLHFSAIKSVQIKNLPTPTGKFTVGYKLYSEDKSHPTYCVFYPASSTTHKHPKYLVDDDMAKKMLEVVQGTSTFPPKWLFDITTHFSRKINLSACIDAPLISTGELKDYTQSEKLIPVIYSHGLGAGRHNYSSLLCQLASKGYFVISTDHRDAVREIYNGIDKYAPEYLEKRVQEVKAIITELMDSSGSIGKLFGNKLNLDMSRLTVMGHSYGGVTAYATAREDERIKNCVMLDPWLRPLDIDSLDKKLSCNVLLFQSGNWNETNPSGEVTVRNTKLMEAHRNNKYGAIYCKTPNSQHCYFSDDILLSGGTLKFLKLIDNIDVADEIHKAYIKAIEDYLAVVVVKGQDSKNFKTLYEGDERFPLVVYS